MVAVDVDAHELGRPPVLRAGPHGLAHLALTGEGGQGKHDDDAGHHRQQRHIGDPQLAAEEGQLAADDGSEVYGVSAEQDLGRVLQKVAHADGGDQHRQSFQPGAMAGRPVPR